VLDGETDSSDVGSVDRMELGPADGTLLGDTDGSGDGGLLGKLVGVLDKNIEGRDRVLVWELVGLMDR